MTFKATARRKAKRLAARPLHTDVASWLDVVDLPEPPAGSLHSVHVDGDLIVSVGAFVFVHKADGYNHDHPVLVRSLTHVEHSPVQFNGYRLYRPEELPSEIARHFYFKRNELILSNEECEGDVEQVAATCHVAPAFWFDKLRDEFFIQYFYLVDDSLLQLVGFMLRTTKELLAMHSLCIRSNNSWAHVHAATARTIMKRIHEYIVGKSARHATHSTRFFTINDIALMNILTLPRSLLELFALDTRNPSLIAASVLELDLVELLGQDWFIIPYRGGFMYLNGVVELEYDFVDGPSTLRMRLCSMKCENKIGAKQWHSETRPKRPASRQHE
eukprot:jgi/Chlat1/6700/Chrsp5S06989